MNSLFLTAFFRLLIIQLQNSHKGFLRDLDISDLPHTLLSFFLFFKKLFLTGDVTAVAFCKEVLTHCFDRLSGNDLLSDRCLDRDLKELTRDLFF